MEDIATLWSYQEMIDELKQKLLYTTLELEQFKNDAKEEIRKNHECVKQLIELVKIAHKERDEAREQLHKLLNKNVPSNNNQAELFAKFQPESPHPNPVRANSSITESNSLSDLYNHTSSPLDLAVSSPEFTNIDSSNVVYTSAAEPKVDHASRVIDSLAGGKALPPKGKLLQAVLEAGPLLQTLLVAGPLPRWRNPPQLQPFHIPPVSIKGCDSPQNVGHQPALRLFNGQMSCGSLSAPMLNFGPVANGGCLGGDMLISPGTNMNGHLPLMKRQRFC